MNQREAFLEPIVNEMISKTQDLEEIGQIIAIRDLEEIWTDPLLEEFATTILGAKGEEIQTVVKTIRDHFLRTVSLLVYIRSPELGNALAQWNYKDHDGGEGCGDRHLHRLTKQELYDRLGCLWGNVFYLARPIFSAIVIEEGQNSVEDHKPIPLVKAVEGDENLGDGKNGPVLKRIIPPGHLRRDKVSNSENCTVAVKTISKGPSAGNEMRILEALRGKLQLMPYIQTYIATIDYVDRTKILSSCASMDLDKFLKGEEIRRWNPVELIRQVKNLACALEFLHRRLEDNVTTFCHMDLKPKNVLVFDSDPSKSIDMVWKLTDFDIASISSAELRKADGHYTITVGTVARQTPSPYQGPELQTSSANQASRIFPLSCFSILATGSAGRRTDIWSLGCIFAEVLAAQMGKLRNLRSGLKDDSNDRENQDGYFYRRKLGGYQLKPTLNALVNGKPPFDNSVHPNGVGVILKMTAIRRTRRCKAAEVKEDLEKLLTQFESSVNN